MPAHSSALPLPAPAVPITAEVRLAYVLGHFWQAFPEAAPVSIGYAGSGAAITVADGAGTFFAEGQPYPTAPHWREWMGQPVPFFFDAAPPADLLALGPGTAHIRADVISSAFYLLSGWQEYFSDERDRHGRFPYAASVQKQYGFVGVPVVNYYFDVLKTAVEHVSGQRLQPRRWAGTAPFAAFISHDIDNLRSAWKAPAKAALTQGRLWSFARQLAQHLARPDAWDNLEAVAAATAAHGAKSTFFLLPEHRKGVDGTPNADYALSTSLRRRLLRLAMQGHEVGLHGSIGTAEDGNQLLREWQRLKLPAHGLRFHYLRWEPRRTPRLVEEAGVDFDSTLGFAEHFGFRHSYCHPFYPFDFVTGEAHRFLEIPLNVMDATLHHPNYLQLPPEEVVPALRPMLEQVARFGGVVSVLWHNENFDPANRLNGPREFAALMQELRRLGAAFVTGKELATGALL
ncbi:hypothetical protein JAO73_12740 [Hymenobacter sp. BT523]|uniref:DUF7033 domain-containing protein n=1 Tax=Hymenobacter sp. BT523 TaxID=2795725 RepID=UPI0018ED9867|nr:hypothetical protein [Hymenobacter sp. BT523]MBJ6109882.1 hypothetical protein [Hymenobacter sp. BT523]